MGRKNRGNSKFWSKKFFSTWDSGVPQHPAPLGYPHTLHLWDTPVPCTFGIPLYPAPPGYPRTLHLHDTPAPCAYGIPLYPAPPGYPCTLHLQDTPAPGISGIPVYPAPPGYGTGPFLSPPPILARQINRIGIFFF